MARYGDGCGDGLCEGKEHLGLYACCGVGVAELTRSEWRRQLEPVVGGGDVAGVAIRGEHHVTDQRHAWKHTIEKKEG